MVNRTNAHVELTATDRTKAAFDSMNRSMRGAQATTKSMQRTGGSWNKGLSQNRRAIQQLGFQMTDFGIQIAGGQNAMLAFTQQGGQMLQVFGPAGAIMAALLTVFGTMSIVMSKTGKTLNDITPIAGVLADEFRMLGEAATKLKELFFDAANVVVNNLDTILISASIVAGFFAARWVAAMVVTRVETAAATGAMIANRVAVIAMGVAAGTTRITMAALGAATALTSAATTTAGVAAGIFTLRVTAARIASNLWAGSLFLTRTALFTVIGAVGLLTKALIRLGIPAIIIGLGYLIERFMALSDAVGGFGNAWTLVVDVFKEAFDRMKLRAEKFELWFKSMIIRLNLKFLNWLSEMVTNFYGMMDAIANKMNSVFNMNLPTGSAEASISAWADVISPLMKEVLQLDEAIRDIEKTLSGPNKALEKMKDILKSIKENRVDVRDWLGGENADGDGDGGGSKKPSDVLAEEERKIETIFNSMVQTVTGSLKEAFGALFDKTKSFRDYAMKALKDILNKVADILMQPLFDMAAGGISRAIFGAVGLPIPGKARGGSVMAGRAYVVGENRPELFVPGQNGTVVPDTRSVSSGGTTSVNISIDARGAQMGVAEQIDARLREIIPSIGRYATAQTRDTQARGL